mmetsp:Transcript_16982/g.38204  ORF Transcript_16982/g.38204 Transcript_16982/m.38204 type:complete len:188 (+) Transcript_16982:630-1193(+)
MVYGHTPNKIFDRFFLSAISILSVTVVGFDYDYTLVTYNDDLLSLIYDMALQRLVDNCQYPIEMLSDLKGKFDPNFSIRGLAVDRETGWICHLSYTHKTAVAWEGREKVSIDQILKEYGGKRALRKYHFSKNTRHGLSDTKKVYSYSLDHVDSPDNSKSRTIRSQHTKKKAEAPQRPFQHGGMLFNG